MGQAWQTGAGTQWGPGPGLRAGQLQVQSCGGRLAGSPAADPGGLRRVPDTPAGRAPAGRCRIDCGALATVLARGRDSLRPSAVHHATALRPADCSRDTPPRRRRRAVHAHTEVSLDTSARRGARAHRHSVQAHTPQPASGPGHHSLRALT
jgi:hypothetical protein